MPLTQTELAVFEDALGTGPQSGNSAPNGHNVQGALNVVSRVAQDMDEYGLALADLPQDKADQYRAAVEDLRHYRQRLATFFGDDLMNELDGIETDSGTVITFPDSGTE